MLLYFEDEDKIELKKEEENQLKHLRDEIEKEKDNMLDEVYENIIEAIREFEKGCFLGSTLICGRINNYLLDKIKLEGDSNINNKINEIIKVLGLNKQKDEKSKLMRVAHFTRNYNSHNIFEMSESSKNLSYLGDSIQLVKLINQYEEKIEN